MWEGRDHLLWDHSVVIWPIAMESRENGAMNVHLSLFRRARSISEYKILAEEELRDRYVWDRLKNRGPH